MLHWAKRRWGLGTEVTVSQLPRDISAEETLGRRTFVLWHSGLRCQGHLCVCAAPKDNGDQAGLTSTAKLTLNMRAGTGYHFLALQSVVKTTDLNL